MDEVAVNAAVAICEGVDVDRSKASTAAAMTASMPGVIVRSKAIIPLASEGKVFGRALIWSGRGPRYHGRALRRNRPRPKPKPHKAGIANDDPTCRRKKLIEVERLAPRFARWRAPIFGCCPVAGLSPSIT